MTSATHANQHIKDSFEPHLFIDIGETGAFFTLRETYLHETYIPGEGAMGNCVVNGVYQGTVDYEVRSFHHCNLSQDADEALLKAREFARTAKLRLDANRANMDNQMRDIKRRSKEQMEEARLEALRAASARTLSYAEQNDARIMDRLVFKGGLWKLGFGRYEDLNVFEVADLDRGYLEWVLENNKDELRYDNSLQSAMIELALERAAPAVESEYFGTVGERVNGIVATVKNVRTFYTNNTFSYGDTGKRTVYTLVTDDGCELVLFTQSPMGKIGERLRFNAKIREHKEYRNVRQTTIQRPTKVEAL